MWTRPVRGTNSQRHPKTPTNMIWRFRFCFPFGPFIKNLISCYTSYYMQVFSIFLFFLKCVYVCVHGRWKVYVSVCNTVSHIEEGPASLTFIIAKIIVWWTYIQSLTTVYIFIKHIQPLATSTVRVNFGQ